MLAKAAAPTGIDGSPAVMGAFLEIDFANIGKVYRTSRHSKADAAAAAFIRVSVGWCGNTHKHNQVHLILMLPLESHSAEPIGTARHGTAPSYSGIPLASIAIRQSDDGFLRRITVDYWLIRQ